MLNSANGDDVIQTELNFGNIFFIKHYLRSQTEIKYVLKL